jgi:hypothetical protein
MISAQIPFRGFRPCSLPKVLRSGSLAHRGNAHGDPSFRAGLFGKHLHFLQLWNECPRGDAGTRSRARASPAVGDEYKREFFSRRESRASRTAL